MVSKSGDIENGKGTWFAENSQQSEKKV